METDEIIVVARQWSACVGKPVRVWMSDKQEAFVKAIAGEFPPTPHRSCQNHFLRAVAEPMLAVDSRAKVKMRRRVRRGLPCAATGVQSSTDPVHQHCATLMRSVEPGMFVGGEAAAFPADTVD